MLCSFLFHVISIHAPREGSDPVRPLSWTTKPHFYPRSPRGERRKDAAADELAISFLSTLPARGATFSPSLSLKAWNISIHAPREGSDRGASLP